MKQSYKNRDIFILLISLIILSYGISFLHGDDYIMPQPPALVSNTTNEKDPLLAVHSNDVMGIISPFLIAHDMEKTSAVIARFLSLPKQKDLVERLIKNRNNDLTVADKVRLIVLMALKQSTSADRAEFFGLFNKHAFLFRESPIVYLAAEQEYTMQAVPFLLEWLNLRPGAQRKAAIWALRAAIMRNNPTMMQRLLDLGVVLTTDQATDLLWYTILQKGKPDFVSMLKKAGADMTSVRNGRTFLIAATEQNQLPLVQVLLQNGALVNEIKDPAVGSALQIAVRKKFADIELLLRDNGARE